MKFQIHSPFKPSGDQPKAIDELVQGLSTGKRDQILMGVTGSGKTFTIANVIERVQRPTLVIAHNKTLAAQLCSEFREFFPNNAVEYFISYYDYYQPEAYLPARDMYIEKEAEINEEIEKLRHRATMALLSRRDVIIVASVSAIYGLGTPEDYQKGIINVEVGKNYARKNLLYQLETSRYTRNDIELKKGRYRIKGDVIDIFPSWDEDLIRLDFFGDTLEQICLVDLVSGKILEKKQKMAIFPATHYVVLDRLDSTIEGIQREMEERVTELKAQNKELEAHRISQRTKYDIEMIREIGYCKGIENYSRHLSGRAPGSAPGVLLNFFPSDFLTILDESHVTVGQIRGMYAGDKSRKQTLIEYGFRLPSAADNRPLTFTEFESIVGQTIYTSATPGNYELEKCKLVQRKAEINPNSIWADYDLVEQIIRPTGLIDPEVVIKPSKNQIDDLYVEIDNCLKRKERVLITALTKRMSENITDFLAEKGFKVQYLHSEIKALDRIDILHDLRSGKYDILVGVNLLREGLDLPEVSLVVIFDADKEGFLRNERSLIQTMGRAARNVHGRAVLYADKMTDSIKKAVKETERRRAIQIAHNQKHGIIPKTISKKLVDIREKEREKVKKLIQEVQTLPETEKAKLIKELEQEMKTAAKELNFELAAEIRDRLMELSKK